MSIKNLVEMIKRNGLLASMHQLEELYKLAIENEEMLAESQREFRSADATIENLQMELNAEREAKLALAAENAGLKAAHPQPFGEDMMRALEAYEWHQDETPETGMLDAFFILRDSIRVDTTSTDAFMDEVRARGVEMFAVWNDKHIKPGVEHKESLTAVSHAARGFAAQIRKGVQP